MSAKPDDFIAPPCLDEIEILYRDEQLLLINKPSGLLSLSGKNPCNWDSVHFRLVQNFPSATLVHRLDFGTSGLMLVALSKAVNGLLTKQFQAGTIRKRYTAILQGHVQRDEGLIDFPIAKDPPNFPLQKICAAAGKRALSEYKVVARAVSPATSRVIFNPLTGRTHQLRIHSRELGHPILGCDLYGNTASFAAAPRLLLHATELSFDHPATGVRVDASCPCPF
jgi:tRNA pseudouridine32 synthase / 23S rRNA pseudouridine746 synthase